MATSKKVIVFGPTGAVGSSAARTAAKLGATVALAMRDTSKPIPGLSESDEKQGSFVRVTADLTKPDTVQSAVESTGSKAAFIYLAHGNTDAMKGTITALKTAGIELVVFLSSFTIQEKLEDIVPNEAIPYWHAQVELTLIDVFGKEGFVALRPGSFASNNLQYKYGIAAGTVKLVNPKVTIDNIVPEDIGRVGGTVLAKGVPEDGNRAIYIYGPELLSQGDTVKTIARVVGKDQPKIESQSTEDAINGVVAHGLPRVIGEYLVRRSNTEVEGLSVSGYSVTEDQLKNVEKYTGQKGTTLEEYIQTNKAIYSS